LLIDVPACCFENEGAQDAAEKPHLLSREKETLGALVPDIL
jgi:hypothetical protein